MLLHWACAKVSASADTADEALLSALDSRLKGQPAIRFCPGPAGHGLACMLSILPNQCCCCCCCCRALLLDWIIRTCSAI